MITRRLVTVIAGTVAAVTATCVPALARSSVVHDPSGDAAGGLDVTRAVVQNRPHAVVVRLHLAGLQRGHVVVSIDRRHGRGRSLVSLRRGDGTVRSFVLGGAFTDPGVGGTVPCRGYRVAWNDEAASVSLRMPSRCLHHGRFGAVRFQLLTEFGDGSDADYAPQDDSGNLVSSPWVPRG